jgi:hypothetical protein
MNTVLYRQEISKEVVSLSLLVLPQGRTFLFVLHRIFTALCCARENRSECLSPFFLCGSKRFFT